MILFLIGSGHLLGYLFCSNQRFRVSNHIFQELACLPMGVIYFITIPSMYLFLTIYSVFNLNVVSWGTREVPKKKTAEEMEQVIKDLNM